MAVPLEQTIIPFDRILLKIRTIVSFFGNTRNPFALAFDALKLNRGPLVAVSRDGIKLRINASSGESFTFYENLIRRDYLSNGITLRPGDTVVDIGANIGSFTVLAARVVGPHGRVVSFEPVAQTFARLEDNVALNGYRNVECRLAAVDAQEGTLTLRVDPKSALSTAYLESHDDENGAVQTVPCVTMEQAFREHNIERVNLLKVDCEGSEYGIFETLAPPWPRDRPDCDGSPPGRVEIDGTTAREPPCPGLRRSPWPILLGRVQHSHTSGGDVRGRAYVVTATRFRVSEIRSSPQKRSKPKPASGD